MKQSSVEMDEMLCNVIHRVSGTVGPFSGAVWFKLINGLGGGGGGGNFSVLL